MSSSALCQHCSWPTSAAPAPSCSRRRVTRDSQGSCENGDTGVGREEHHRAKPPTAPPDPPLWTHHLTYIVRVEDMAPGQPACREGSCGSRPEYDACIATRRAGGCRSVGPSVYSSDAFGELVGKARHATPRGHSLAICASAAPQTVPHTARPMDAPRQI